MSYLEAMNELKKSKPAPVYLLYGTEPYFIQNIKDAIEQKVMNGEEGDLSVYDLEEMPIEEAITDAETYPFFSEQKLVIAHNPVFLKANPDKLPFEHRTAVLEQYLEEPAPYTVLVLIAPYEKLDERKKIVKTLKKKAVVAECNPVKEHEFGRWIGMIAEQYGLSIDKDAYEIIEGEMAGNLRLLQNEMEKISLYVGEGGRVTKETAEKLVARSSSSTALGLVDSVIAKDLNKAVRIYQDLEKMKEEPIALIGLLAFQFRTIFRVKLLKMKGYSQQQMQKQLGVHPYVIKIAASREKDFTTERLEKIMTRFAQADAAMKQGAMDKGLAFELLLYDLVKAE